MPTQRRAPGYRAGPSRLTVRHCVRGALCARRSRRPCRAARTRALHRVAAPSRPGLPGRPEPVHSGPARGPGTRGLGLRSRSGPAIIAWRRTGRRRALRGPSPAPATTGGRVDAGPVRGWRARRGSTRPCPVPRVEARLRLGKGLRPERQGAIQSRGRPAPRRSANPPAAALPRSGGGGGGGGGRRSGGGPCRAAGEEAGRG